jgi:SNF2 family DNA or RNA helicase
MVFLDEAHEIQNMAKSNILTLMIQQVQSTSKWNITGTPFANGLNSFVNLVKYNSTFTGSCKSLDDIVDTGLNENLIQLYKQLFRRNTKQSIKTEYSGKLIVENMHSLVFTQQERSLYDSYIAGGKSKHIDFLIKICCHSELYEHTKELIKNCKTLQQIQEVMLKYNKNQLKMLQSTIRKLQHDIEVIQIEIINMGDVNPYDNTANETLANLKSRLGTAKRKHTITNTQFDTVQRTYNYLVNAIKSIESSDEICPICLDTIDTTEKTITKCGHKFCWSCISETHKIKTNDRRNSFTCPTCNTQINMNEIYIYQQQENTIIENELQQIIHLVKSTKIGNIIHYLKTELVPGDKVILFSQWDELLHKVGNMLEEQRLKIVYCSGTVFQRKRAIQNFMNPNNDTNIILLSSRNAASGINLTEANKIILLEPVYGSSDYRANIESQAIGRADRIGQKRPIEVHRFIIKNTIEEDIIDGKIEDNEIFQLRI